MKKKNLKNCLVIAASAILTLSLLTGCGTSQSAETKQPQTANEVAGTILLSINPEIEVEYDKNGLVLEIEGINEDGKNVANGFGDYNGKEIRTVVNDLIKKIYDSGYFNETVDGHAKNIVLKLENGSTYPNDEFLEEIAKGVRDAVRTCGIGSETITVQVDDLDDAGRIGLDKAKELVLAQLGLDSATFHNHEYELDDDVYEFEFTANGVDYEYEVDARTGKVLEADIESNDDWDDRDDWNDDETVTIPANDDDDRDDYDDRNDYDDQDDYNDHDDFDDHDYDNDHDDFDDHDDYDDHDDFDDHDDYDNRDDSDDRNDNDGQNDYDDQDDFDDQDDD